MQTLSPEQKALFEQAATRYQNDLASDISAQAYLTSRGITQATALGARLGVVGSPIAGHEGFRGRLAIPYVTPSGIVNFSFRCLQPHDCKAMECPKYLAIDGMGRNLYNVLDVKRAGDWICVTEGELDALTLSMIGMPALGIPGVEHWQPHWGLVLADFANVWVFADGDRAGRKFAKFLAREARARPVSMPKGEDVNSLYLKGGREALHALIQS